MRVADTLGLNWTAKTPGPRAGARGRRRLPWVPAEVVVITLVGAGQAATANVNADQAPGHSAWPNRENRLRRHRSPGGAGGRGGEISGEPI